MKTLLLLLFPLFTLAQSPKIGAGFSLGYSTKQAMTGEMSIGYRPIENVVIYPVNIKVHASREVNMPQIFESRAAYRLNTWEVYGGIGYHLMDRQKYGNEYGFKPALGLHKHFGAIVLSAEMSGEVFSLQVGIFKFK